jgi:glycosyltransferase involved in cell wall biosynthesis
VLLLAYICSPNHGSESGIGWNFAVRMARHFEISLITLGDRYADDVQDFLHRHGAVPGLTIHRVYRPWWLRWLRRMPGMYYVAYNAWHRLAYRLAAELHAKSPFDLAHQFNLCGFREPGYLWKLGIPFVWGPVGGTQNYPSRFLSEAGIWGAIYEVARSFGNALQLRFSPRIRRAIHSSAALFAANSTNCRDLQRTFGVAPTRLLETGAAEVAGEPKQPPSQPRPLRILWSGNLAPWKGLPLLLKALHRLPNTCSVEVRILGKGPSERYYRSLARKLDVDSDITWMGWLPRDEAQRQNAWADVLAFTSLRDTSGNVVLEALSAGVPVLCLDHQGVADIVTPECGIKIPVSNPTQVTRSLAEALVRLATQPHERCELSAGALHRAADYLWSRQVDCMAEAYRQILGLETSETDLVCPAERIAPSEATFSLTESGVSP